MNQLDRETAGRLSFWLGYQNALYVIHHNSDVSELESSTRKEEEFFSSF